MIALHLVGRFREKITFPACSRHNPSPLGSRVVIYLTSYHHSSSYQDGLHRFHEYLPNLHEAIPENLRPYS